MIECERTWRLPDLTEEADYPGENVERPELGELRLIIQECYLGNVRERSGSGHDRPKEVRT